MANEVTETQEQDIDIPNGALLNIKIEGIDIPTPITSSYVGMVKKEYILITPPAPFAIIKPKLFPGNKLVIQYLFEGTIFVFVTKIIDVLAQPIKSVILEYPDKVINRKLRSEKRTICRIPASIAFKGLSKNGIIDDVNIKGCRLLVKYQPAEKNFIARTGESFKISCRFPTIPSDFILTGTVRNINKKNLSLSYGIQFEELPAEVRTVIEQYVET